MTVKLQPYRSTRTPPGLLLIKNGHGLFLTLEEAQKLVEELPRAIEQLFRPQKEVRMLAH